jgi:hypothetical protein
MKRTERIGQQFEASREMTAEVKGSLERLGGMKRTERMVAQSRAYREMTVGFKGSWGHREV